MHLGLLMLRLRDPAEGLQVVFAMHLRELVVDEAARVFYAYKSARDLELDSIFLPHSVIA
jgi:hypothetical protein